MSARPFSPTDGSGDAPPAKRMRMCSPIRYSRDFLIASAESSPSSVSLLEDPSMESETSFVATAIPPSSPVCSTVTAVEADSNESFSVISAIEAESNGSFSMVTAISPEKPPVDLNESVESLILTAVSPMSSPPKERTFRSQMRSPVKRREFKKRPDTPMPFRGIVGRLPFPREQESDCDDSMKSMDKSNSF